VAKDEAKGREWYEKAAAGGDALGKKWVAEHSRL
jgi:TPR repeat protein